MNQKYILTRKQSEIVRSMDDDGDYFPAQVASENRLTPSEASDALEELQRQGIVQIIKVQGYESPKIKLTETGGKIRWRLTQPGSVVVANSTPSVLVLDGEHPRGLKLGQGEKIETELDRVIKNLG